MVIITAPKNCKQNDRRREKGTGELGREERHRFFFKSRGIKMARTPKGGGGEGNTAQNLPESGHPPERNWPTEQWKIARDAAAHS